jgi:membrane-associated protease RseP (regulator of RpoE activity)
MPDGPLQHFVPDDFTLPGAYRHFSDGHLVLDYGFHQFFRSQSAQIKDGATRNLAFCNGSLKADANVAASILFVNGDVHIEGKLSNTFLFCDGDVHAGAINRSTVIASGDFFTSNEGKTIVSSTVLVGGKVHTKPEHIKDSIVRSDEKNPLCFVHWFSAADVGFEVSDGKGPVRVEKVHSGKLPEKAGLKVGDVVTGVDGVAVDSAESFRKRLRRGAVRDCCLLTVQRGGVTHDVVLKFWAEEKAASGQAPK